MISRLRCHLIREVAALVRDVRAELAQFDQDPAPQPAETGIAGSLTIADTQHAYQDEPHELRLGFHREY
ncbi:hypothetical protein [Acrocarpospora sp. B8E8]|uniref:hypothetical protein n=1 Tax=Acrocarpospora sp. B8E8 TaxID=3153572 RepID=UPI00325E826A